MDIYKNSRLDLMCELFLCVNEHYWECTSSLTTVYSTHPASQYLQPAFLLDIHADFLRDHIKKRRFIPLFANDVLGLSWIIVFEEQQDHDIRLHLLGPTFTSDNSRTQIDQQLYRHPFSRGIIDPLRETLQELPVMPMSVLMYFGVMLHFCISGEKINAKDFIYLTNSSSQQETSLLHTDHSILESDRTWLSEQFLLKCVEEGQLNYRQLVPPSYSEHLFELPLDRELPFSQFKKKFAALIVLISRASIRGGLDSHTAYSLNDYYLLALDDITTLPSAISFMKLLCDDFIQRVHSIKSSKQISPYIMECCNYLDLHLIEKVQMSDLARKIGYSENYLGKKFKKEIGYTPAEYVKRKRIDRGKILLHSTKKSIQEISDELGFCNPSYFTAIFLSYTNMTPTQYRNNAQV